MAAAAAPRKPRFEPISLLLSRKFWIAIGAVVVASLAVYALVAVPVGPTSFSFEFAASACGCQHTTSTNHSFPNHAFVSLTFTSHYLGSVAEYVLLVYDPTGTEIVYAVMEWGAFGAVNYENVSESFTTTAGGNFEFMLLGTEPGILPGLTAWVNGTYNAPTLS